VGKFIPVEPEKWAEMVKAWAENARLKAEVERLNNESDILQKCCEHQKNRIERLKAEVERLTKAGDEVIREWSSGDEKAAKNFMKALVIWSAAKEGKQS
jgi:predicted RNase H-like nuclease (RuvC/YqgF family)